MIDWKQKVEDYCKKYNIPVFYLAETLYEPKVVPMIRGKAFEFSVMMALQEILPKDKWLVDKPMMNAQIGFHDIDVRFPRMIAEDFLISIRNHPLRRVKFLSPWPAASRPTPRHRRPRPRRRPTADWRSGCPRRPRARVWCR